AGFALVVGDFGELLVGPGGGSREADRAGVRGHVPLDRVAEQMDEDEDGVFDLIFEIDDDPLAVEIAGERIGDVGDDDGDGPAVFDQLLDAIEDRAQPIGIRGHGYFFGVTACWTRACTISWSVRMTEYAASSASRCVTLACCSSLSVPSTAFMAVARFFSW